MTHFLHLEVAAVMMIIVRHDIRVMIEVMTTKRRRKLKKNLLKLVGGSVRINQMTQERNYGQETMTMNYLPMEVTVAMMTSHQEDQENMFAVIPANLWEKTMMT
jgi:hypothetical protein